MSIPSGHSFNPEGFFRFASSIIRDSNASEAALRSAISRAYYAVYLVARDRLFGIDAARLIPRIQKRIDKEFKLQTRLKRGPGPHERMIFVIKQKSRNITLSQQFEQLKEARVNADYQMSYTVLSVIGKGSWREYAEETMQLATLILPSAKSLPTY